MNVRVWELERKYCGVYEFGSVNDLIGAIIYPSVISSIRYVGGIQGGGSGLCFTLAFFLIGVVLEICKSHP